MIEVVNRQRARKVATEGWRRFGEGAMKALDREGEAATIAFVSDRAIKELNRRFRGKDYPTDVLSFPNRPSMFEVENHFHLGDVVISVPRAAAQAKQHRLSFAVEVKHLILHGLLHLCGYDHETDNGEMKRLELRLRRRLGI